METEEEILQIKDFQTVVGESTCQKRITVCEIFDHDNNLLSIESNRCSPQGGVCCRLGVVQNKENYDKDSNCNWTHAEINAVNTLKTHYNPHKAIVYGHDFICDSCEKALRDRGISVLEVKPLKLYKTLNQIMYDHNLFGPIREPAPYYYERVRLVAQKFAAQECEKILVAHTG